MKIKKKEEKVPINKVHLLISSYIAVIAYSLFMRDIGVFVAMVVGPLLYLLLRNKFKKHEIQVKLNDVV